MKHARAYAPCFVSRLAIGLMTSALLLLGYAHASAGQQCVYLVTPAETSVIELTPALQWVDICGPAMFTVRVSINSSVVYSAVVYKNSAMTALVNELLVPEGLLFPGEQYNWAVDAGDHGIASASFKTLSTARRAEALDRISQEGQSGTGTQSKEALINFLMIEGLSEMALVEADRLQQGAVSGWASRD